MKAKLSAYVRSDFKYWLSSLISQGALQTEPEHPIEKQPLNRHMVQVFAGDAKRFGMKCSKSMQGPDADFD